MQARDLVNPSQTFSGNRALLYGGVLAAMLIVLASSLLGLAYLRNETALRTTIATQNLTRSLEQTIEGMIDSIDVALLASADEIGRQLSAKNVDRQAITQMLIRQQLRLTLVDSLRATNEQGEIIYGPETLTPPILAHDREYFMRPRDEPGSGLFISSPILGRLDNRWVWLFARRVNKSDGSFGGVVFARMQIDHLTKLMTQFRLQSGSAIALRDTELGMIARVTFNSPNSIPIGDKRLSTPFQDALKANPQEGSYVSDASIADRIGRIYSYRRSAKYGFTVLAGIEVDSAFAEWREQAWAIGGLVAAFSAASLAFLWLIRRAWQRQEQDFAALENSRRSLQESEKRLRSVIELSPLGIAFSRDGITLDANPAYLHMFGCDRVAELAGTPLIQQIAPQSRADVMDRVKRRSQGHTAEMSYETVGLRKDGSQFPFIVSSKRIDLPDGPVTIAFFIDITERKQAETEHARLEAQLRESQKMEALGTMAGGVAHDFNNALAMIIGNVELARQDVGPGHPALVSLDEIGKASRRAKDLVQQILSFGRRQKLERKATSLALVVVETARLVRATLPEMVELKVDCAGDTPAVLADATQIKQVLLNLCSNALQALQEQGRPGVIEIDLRAYTHEEGQTQASIRPGRYACLSVRDNGPGMDAATREHIFEPFFTTKPMGRGTGLGLSVVHGIVQAHEAHMEVESAPGKGSSFRICFPAVDLPVEAHAPPKSDAAPVQGAGKRVLYVDDEEAIIFLMTRLLERKGFRVSGYTDPHQALAAARADPDQFDLAVTDYNMPGLSGLALASALRKIRADLPVVLASGYITEELRQRASAAGVRELIYKPNTVDDLCEAVARYANARGKIE